jgi:hypothetical protein
MNTDFPSPPSKWKSYSLSILVFALGFVIVAAAIHMALPNPLRLYADMRSEKIELLDTWKGGVYAAAFGSSHVNDGFDPRAFDDELTAMQRRTPSINLGIEGGSQTEQRVMALEFLRHFSGGAAAGHQPCYVMLELNAGANFTPNHLVHPRAINIYDWATTKFVTQLSEPGFSRVHKAERDGYALAAMTMHYTNVGMLSNAILQPPIDKELYAEETSDGREGLHDLSDVDAIPVEAAEDPDPPGKPVAVEQALSPGNGHLIEELAAASDDPHLHFVYFVMPIYSNLRRFPDYPATMQTGVGVVPIFNLARPDLYPQLFEPKYWHDPAHLNADGAALVSRILADQLKAWNATHHWDQTCGE